MKSKYKILFVVVFLLLFNKLFAEGDINIFQRNAINNNSTYFDINDNFNILGNIEVNGLNIVLANNVHYWGVSTHRATWRLLLFLIDGTFLGIYTGITFNINEIKIEGHKIYFPFKPKIGNVIDFSKGIPNEIWIDGHIILYEKINDI
ncbi:MAG: hypothetical protein LBB89_12885 [Treponema sp.]|jgi:hypothetical protein|nr:hypothetical protein [Treponema sp.]